ncbi:MAG: hypothetical protein KTR20_03480 [Cellvibrionaceae bacterium]|nr:hypothetical protein [Cellvibrionaceae bacterium]
MGIYHLLLWLRKHDNLASLSFGLFCLIMAYREIFIAERIIYIIFPDIANATVVKSDLFTVYAGLPLMHLFIHFLFPKQSPVKWVHISGLIAIGLTAVLLFGSLYASEAAILPFEIYVLLLLLLCFYIGIKAVIEKEDGAVIFLIGYLGVFAAAVNDILYERGVIDTAFIFYIGTLFFVFSQASIISKRFASAYVELELLKNSLENTVNIRTRELRIARDEALNISEQNKRLSTSMTSAIENERKTIATEIHDNFNSIMVATRMQAVSILNMINDGANHQAEIARIAGNIRDNMKTSYTEARALVSRLRPESIDALPLDAALRELLNTYKTDQMHIAFNASGDSQLFNHEELKINLYRICQEALTNILKHAQANTITVNLAMNKDCHLTINDNGRGFNTDTVPGNGLTHIKQRTLGLGGTFTITSGETGTTISITVPSAC